jgi:RNA polymerase sigma factor (TIGR02999 family)
VTRLVNALHDAQRTGGDAGFAHVYEELRRIAGRQIRRERRGCTLDTTTLVHEAFLRLANSGYEWQNRAHFFGAAAIAMRRVLIDAARRRTSRARAAPIGEEPLATIRGQSGPIDPVELLALDEALRELEQFDKRMHELVMLRCFAGLSVAEAAEALGVSERTCKRDWAFARAWLYRRLSGGDMASAGYVAN